MLIATLIGDVLSSREAGDRAALHHRLQALLDEVNGAFAPVTPLRFTVGDEYQGAFATVGRAQEQDRDERVGGLSDRSVSVLRGLLGGSTQREIAEELGISPSAISQRVRADGLAALVAADESMGRVR